MQSWERRSLSRSDPALGHASLCRSNFDILCNPAARDLKPDLETPVTTINQINQTEQIDNP